VRDGTIAALDQGQVESLWISEQLGRPVVKAWNAITAGSFRTKNTARGTSGRIAIPVAADSDDERAVGLTLVDETGFDSGALSSPGDSSPARPPTAPTSPATSSKPHLPRQYPAARLADATSR
jgi:hypothetical protein